MSADNGVYLLKTPKGENGVEFRVAHLQNIEDLWWDESIGDFDLDNHKNAIINARERFAHSKKVHNNHTEALEEAMQIYDEIMEDDFAPICEYGISIVEINEQF